MATSSTTGSSRMIKVKVKTMEPATYEVTLQNQDSVSDLKDKLVPLVHAPKERLRLIFHGRALGDDQETLEHAGIRDEDTVHLVVRPPDAPPPPSSTAATSSSTPSGNSSADPGGINRFLQGVMSSLTSPPSGPGAAGSASNRGPPGSTTGRASTTTTTTPAGGNAGGGGDRSAASAAGGGPDGGPEEVPHLLATFAAYLQRLQSPDFNPAPVPISSLALGTPLEEVLVALTESIQNILQGTYLPSHLQALLDTSMTDPAGLLPATPSSSSSAPAASGQPTTTSSTTNNQGASVVVEEPVSDEVISESLGPADAQRWRATLAADQARQAEVQQQQEGQEPAKHSKAYAAMRGF